MDDKHYFSRKLTKMLDIILWVTNDKLFNGWQLLFFTGYVCSVMQNVGYDLALGRQILFKNKTNENVGYNFMGD